jgi:1,4-alpha-glucan branching enzyme
VVDDHFEWSDDNFVMTPQRQQVLYEIHVGTFFRPDPPVIGTFDDIAAKLDYLADLGVTALSLMPINSMDDDEGWGYRPDYLYAVESLYGGRRAFKELVNAAHQRGIAVILDVVYNHAGLNNDLWQFDGWSQDGKGGFTFITTGGRIHHGATRGSTTAARKSGSLFWTTWRCGCAIAT